MSKRPRRHITADQKAEAARVDLHWAAFFGLDVARMGEPGVHLVPHAALGDYYGVWLFRREASCIVSAPGERLTTLEPLRERSVRALDDRGTVARLFPTAAAIVGPAFHASLAPDCFHPRGDPQTRLLGDADAAAVEALRASCGAEDWRAGGPPEGASLGSAGCFRDGALVALATLRDKGGGACDPAVVAHPDWRGRGCGTAAVSAAVQHALDYGRLVLYQTLVANAPAVALARSLGFDPYATHLAVRFA